MSKANRNRQNRNKPRVQAAPFDLDAREKEIQDKGESQDKFRFTYKGREYALQPFGTLDRIVIRKAVDGDQESAFKEAMTDDEWREFREHPLSIDGMNDLAEEWAEHSGIDLGN